MINWQQLFSAHLWFAINPGPLGSTAVRYLLVAFIICLAIGVVFYLWARARGSDRVTFRLLKKFQSLFTTLSLVGFVILFFFWQQVPFLASRFWLIVWLLIALIWLGFIGNFGFFEAPKRRVELREKEKFEKYLPKKRK